MSGQLASAFFGGYGGSEEKSAQGVEAASVRETYYAGHAATV
jgi:hypothetical protein